MTRPSRTTFTGFLIVIIVVIGSLASLLFLISPTQAGQAVLHTSVNVAATAQAIQFQNRQAELKAADQAQKNTWEATISNERQALTDFNQNAETQAVQLQSDLERLQTQIDQVTADLQATQDRMFELQQAIDNDAVNYQSQLAALDQEMSQQENELRHQLEATSTALQTAYDELEASRPAPTTPPADTGEPDHNNDDGGGGGEDKADGERPEDNSEDQKDSHGDGNDGDRSGSDNKDKTDDGGNKEGDDS